MIFKKKEKILQTRIKKKREEILEAKQFWLSRRSSMSYLLVQPQAERMLFILKVIVPR